MQVGIMQPYFLPYIGYFQLIAAVDVFVVYDNIKYTKRGWINRNRLLTATGYKVFSLPLQKAPDRLNIDKRQIAADFEKSKFLNQFSGVYRKAPFYFETIGLLEKICNCNDRNLFAFLQNALILTLKHLGINTEVVNSSSLNADHNSAGQDRVLSICKTLGAHTYLNPIGGQELYCVEEFAREGIQLQFLRPTPPIYSQFSPPFIPNLSIIDVMMFNDRERILEMISNGYERL